MQYIDPLKKKKKGKKTCLGGLARNIVSQSFQKSFLVFPYFHCSLCPNSCLLLSPKAEITLTCVQFLEY